jgi:hypothetical protein
MSKQKLLIKKTLEEINATIQLHESQANRWKTLDNLCEGGLLVLGLTTTFLLTANPVHFAVASTVTSALGTALSGLKKTSNFRKKYSEAYATTTHLKNVYRDTLVQLTKNHLSSDDLDQLLRALTHELQLSENLPTVRLPSISGIVDPREKSPTSASAPRSGQ